MTATETIERLTELVKMQADIIKEQSHALMQLGAVTDVEETAAEVARVREEIIGE